MNFKEIKELIRVFDKSELNKLKVKESDFEISLQKGFETTVASIPSSTPATPQAPAPTVAQAQTQSPQESTSQKEHAHTINAPMVGTFYSCPSPESPAFVKAGDAVKKGQTLCILEAMKIMNEVEAEFDCKIIEVLVEDGSPIEYDMPLFAVEKI